MMRKIAIVNTKCYHAKKNIAAKYIIDKIGKDIGANLVFTEYPRHAEKIAKDSSDYDIIIAAGGDGTLSQIVNGMNLEMQALAVVPLGTANSFARDLKITSLRSAFDTIKKNKTIKIDLLSCQFETNNASVRRYGVATSGFGFASATAELANRYFKMTGPFCYPLSACSNSFNQGVLRAKIQIDNSPFKEIKFTNFIINNAKHAGNILVFPEADLRDSALNLLHAKTNVLTQYLWNISVFTKTYFYYPGSKTANRLHIILNKPSSFMLDGEIFKFVKEIKYAVIPQKLTVLK